jgi:hypothetical protein
MVTAHPGLGVRGVVGARRSGRRELGVRRSRGRLVEVGHVGRDPDRGRAGGLARVHRLFLQEGRITLLSL